MNVVVIGLSHHSSPVELRERFAFAEAAIPDGLRALRDSGVAGEAVILSTCNRVEIYAATALEPPQAFDGLKQFLKNARGFDGSLDEEIYTLAEPQSLHHLFKVACGLDSMVLGETEILGQIKRAYAMAQRHGHTGARLNRAFQHAFHTAKHVRTHTQIQRGNLSVASVAVELAEKIFNSLRDCDVLVIGAGETSAKAARALVSRGARRLVVASRTLERARALAAELGGRAVPFEEWTTEFETVAIAISGTSAPRPILDRARLAPLMKARKSRPLLLIDIAVPRDVDPEVNLLENVYLYNIDDLQAIADACLKQRTREIARCEAIIGEKVAALIRKTSFMDDREARPPHSTDLQPSAPPGFK
ncbi:MAG: glutamyl-tRNA reductase [Verrucomicrobiota bacterium]|nr:glutamyl-tRNA reductase [Verrucomicrobiota bacterium]